MSNEEMDTSENNYHCRKKKLRCHACSYTTWSSENFVAHCLDHTKENLFICEHCDFKTNYRYTIKKHNLKCIKNQKKRFSECFNIAIDEIVNHHILSLSDIINLICSKDKSLDTNTIGLATTEFLKCLECTFETGNQKILKLHSQIHVEVKKCTECNFESKDADTFKDHLISHFKSDNIKEQKVRDKKEPHLSVKRFKCSDCSYKTKYKKSFDAHCAEHKNIKLFKCDDCDFESNYKNCLIRHSLYRCSKKTELNSNKNCVFVQSKNTEFSSLSLSEIMLLIFNKRKSLDENASVPSSTEPLKCQECIQKCPECGYESTNDTETFKDHLIKIHLDQPTSESESAPSSLRKRSKQFNKTFVDILSDEEKNEITVNDKNQDSNFEDEMSNEEIDTRDNKYLRTKKKFRCHDCSYTTCKSEDLVAHCLDHANKKLFKCEHCDFKTNYKRSLRNHNFKCLKNHENSLSECFGIAFDKNLDYHLLSLSEIISLICNKGKSLDHNTSDETTTEIFKCLECPFETRNQKILNLHSQIHVEVKKCTECNFESKDTATFKDHIIVHFKHKNIEEQKMFKCSDCSYKTKYKESHDAHCAEHKNIKLFKCDDCDFESNYKKGLKRHSLNHCSKKAKLNSNNNCVVNQSKKTEFSSLSLSEIMILIFNKRKLLEENASVPSPAEPLKCCECNFETENPKYFEFHSQIHSEVQKCPECGYESTNDTETFKDHLITHLGQSRSDIESVPYSFKSNKTFKEYFSNEEHSEVKMKREFVSHLLLHNKDKTDCGYISTNLDNIKVYTLSDIISMICDSVNEVNQDKNLNSETKLHKCSQCSFECSDEVQLSQHLSSHSTEEKFICSQCSFEGTNQSDLDSHLQTHSTFKCSKCLCEFSDIVSWNSHRCELKSDNVFKCLRCNFETKNKKHFTLHSQIHAKLRKCTECNFSHLHRNKFQSHLMTHLPKKLYSCTECGYKTNLIHKLKVHFLNHAGKKVFHCPKCDYKTNHKANLRNHIENHLEFKSYRCSECNYSTSQSFSLKLHILDHSQKKLFLCSECDYGCNSKTRMSRHVLQHSKEKLYKCSRCDFETNYIKNLKDHEARRHGGSFSYACSHCDFKCYKRSSLTAHSVIHSNTKLLKCPECSYECKKNLKLHMINMHSKTKIYKCSQCKYEGNHRSNFLTHIRTHSNERKFSCSECSFACNRKDNLKVHMTTHLKEKLSCAECSYKCSNKQQYSAKNSLSSYYLCISFLKLNKSTITMIIAKFKKCIV
ncbi:Zinc finger protein [Armadillidium nasatum]|uniref:Zinc finger protein n=1 Tax=Armadillidium nasatum TaxID=96803 RepID=A0A5N5SNB3_9CRUS|nr:Zinc finger protein [Armadillidium nasatum]